MAEVISNMGVLQKIKEAALGKIEQLDLSDQNLTELPIEIGELIALKSLNLSGNRLKSLPIEIGNLTNLQKLNVRSNNLEYLPVEIGNLQNLITLDLWNNQLTEFPPSIGKLVSLRELIAGVNNLVRIPSEIRNLKKLEILTLGTNLKYAGADDFLARWIATDTGDGRMNQLIDIPKGIGNLTELRFLDLGDNKLSKLPREIQRLKKLEVLWLRGNPLSLPPEILQKVANPEILFSIYFNSRYPLNEVKMLFVGQGSVGKTSLIIRMLRNEFENNQAKTEGISINHWQPDDQSQIALNVWDFGGQEIMHATHQFFLTKRSLYLLVLDSRLTQEENRVEYWLKIIQSFGGESPVLIVGNKIDQHPLDIDRTGLQKKYPNIVGILETSAATGTGIEALKAAITEQVNNLPHVRDLLPETWFTVKNKLEELGRQSNFITHDKYLELCAENEVSDETSQRTLIGFLHDLGVVLHFQDDPRLEALGILNPQWVTNGVYKILNSHTLFQNKGVLTTSMLDEILNLPEYPRGKRLFIVDMMKKFELCYNLEPDKSFLVPDLLPKDEPAELKFKGVPAFEYAYPVLPSSVITRFIVRMNQKIDDGFVWRTGVVLKIGENKALVKADIEDRKITIAIDGLEHTRRDALSAIRYQLDEIHGSIKGLDAQKRVPVPNAPLAEPLKYDYLLKLERSGQEFLPVENGNDLITVNVRQMLSAIESESQRKGQQGNVINNIYVGGNFDGNLVAGNENKVERQK
jgi:internalin A